jgi:pimeloyl-ACP methyl ester carboxylesterase
VDALGLGRPYSFGHSCGGASLLLAEEERPGLLRRIYCYEPIVTPTPEPLQPWFDNPLSLGALRRRQAFPSKADALANYGSKPPLDGLSATALGDYVEHGFEDAAGGGVQLRCRPEVEARTFAYGVAHDAFSHLPKVACPARFACGALSPEFGEDVMLQLADRLECAGGSASVMVFDNLGHFGPLQRPDLVAADVLAALRQP